MTMTARETAANFRRSIVMLNIAVAAASSPKDLGEALATFEEALEAALLAERKAALAEAAGTAEIYVAEYTTRAQETYGRTKVARKMQAEACQHVAAAILALSPEGKGPDDHTPEEET